MRKIIDAFGNGTIGTSFVVLGGLYFTENIFIIVLLGGIGAVLGQVFFPLFTDLISNSVLSLKFKHPKVSVSYTFVFISIFAIIIGYGYLTFDTYSKGQYLYTNTQVKLKKKPSVGGGFITILDRETQVTYIDKNWKRIRWYEDGHRFFNFWRKVKDENNNIGWIYGGYLTE